MTPTFFDNDNKLQRQISDFSLRKILCLLRNHEKFTYRILNFLVKNEAFYVSVILYFLNLLGENRTSDTKEYSD